ncbi:MAG TPA: FtsX-like permease family protein [Nevskiaceae bacterium]|nr:FtsX-like permease family protein [Nevskiaceae bacterium]
MKYLPLLWATLWRRRARTIYTMASIAVAFLLYGLLNGVNMAFSSGVEAAGADRLMTAGKYSFTEILPLSYYQQIKNIPGVKAVTHATWFGGVYIDEHNFIPQFPVDQDTYFDVYPEMIIDPKQLQAFKDTRDGVLAGVELARRFGWKIGDRIPLQATIWPNKQGGNDWSFQLVGLIDAKNEAARAQSEALFFRYDYFDEERQYGKGKVGWYIVRLDDPKASDQIAAAIDKQFSNSANETRTDTEKAFNQSFIKQMGDIELIIRSILGAVFFTLLLLTGNTMMQSVRERVPELAVLKTLGFTDGAVLALVLAESLLLCVFAALIGLLLSGLIMPGLGAKAQMPGMQLTGALLASGCGVAVLLALVVGAVPATRAMRLQIVNALSGHT